MKKENKQKRKWMKKKDNKQKRKEMKTESK